MFLWGHDGGQEELHVTDGLLHDHVKHTEKGAPLIQHLLGGRCGEIPENFASAHTDISPHKHTRRRQK